MKLLFIGGTGNISTSCSKLALALGHELWLLHRPGRPGMEGAHDLACDINDEKAAAKVLAPHRFDVVAGNQDTRVDELHHCATVAHL